ncbi:hypothetical protein CsSME_00046813 [Camellia sinensis var. sinensis]
MVIHWGEWLVFHGLALDIVTSLATFFCLCERKNVMTNKRDFSENFIPSQVADLPLAATTPEVENVEEQIDDNSGKEMIMNDKACDSTSEGLEMQHDIEVDERSKVNDKLYAEKSGGFLPLLLKVLKL